MASILDSLVSFPKLGHIITLESFLTICCVQILINTGYLLAPLCNKRFSLAMPLLSGLHSWHN